MKVTPLEQLTFDNFAALVKTTFRVEFTDASPAVWELSEATTPRIYTSGGAKSQRFENFSLMFTGAADRLLPQGTYWLAAEKTGRFELFIVPVGRDAKGTYYQATFNRLAP